MTIVQRHLHLLERPSAARIIDLFEKKVQKEALFAGQQMLIKFHCTWTLGDQIFVHYME